MFEYRKLIVCLVLLATVVLLNVPHFWAMRLRSSSRDVIAPFQSALTLGGGRLRESLDSLTGARRVMREKNRQAVEITRLQFLVDQYSALADENRELRELLNFNERMPYRLVVGEVIGRGDPSGWWQMIRINCGSDDGVRPNLAVISPQGLIGKTTEVSGQTSDVLLITDPNCRVACRLLRTGGLGVVRGGGVRPTADPELELLYLIEALRMDYISLNQQLQPDDIVVTSGLGGIFPEGLRVGRVKSAGTEPGGLYQRAAIVPSADLRQLRFVSVVVPVEGGGADNP